MKRTDFVNFVNESVHGTTSGSFAVETDVKLKKGNPFGKVKCLQTLNGMIGFDYSNSVNNLALKENKDVRETKERAWGVLSDNRIWVLHTPKGETEVKFYLQMKVQKRLDNATEFPIYLTEDGKEVEYEALKEWKYATSKSSTQSDLDGEVIVRDIKLENIREARILGSVITID